MIEPKIATITVLEIVDKVAASYPTDIFPPDSGTSDSKAAEGARIACAEIRRLIVARVVMDI